jgi:hypothetical protein
MSDKEQFQPQDLVLAGDFSNDNDRSSNRSAVG